MISFLISTALHPLWCYIFVIKENYGLVGLTIAGFISNLITLTLMHLFFQFQSDIKAANVAFDKRALKDLSLYIQIGIPNVVAHVVSCFALE